MKQHKDIGQLIMLKPKDEYYLPLLGEEYSKPWLFMGNNIINDRDRWCFYSLTGKSMSMYREPRRSWKATALSNGYIVEILTKV